MKGKYFLVAVLSIFVFSICPYSSAAEDKTPQSPPQHKSGLLTRYTLTLDLAEKIADACVSKAKELGTPVGIVILDGVGNVKLSYLMDNQSVLSISWAQAKALSSFEFKQPTSKGEFRVWNIAGKTMVLGVAGGYPLMLGDDILGAIGISGTKSNSDDKIALAGVEAFNQIMSQRK